MDARYLKHLPNAQGEKPLPPQFKHLEVLLDFSSQVPKLKARQELQQLDRKDLFYHLVCGVGNNTREAIRRIWVSQTDINDERLIKIVPAELDSFTLAPGQEFKVTLEVQFEPEYALPLLADLKKSLIAEFRFQVNRITTEIAASMRAIGEKEKFVIATNFVHSLLTIGTSNPDENLIRTCRFRLGAFENPNNDQEKIKQLKNMVLKEKQSVRDPSMIFFMDDEGLKMVPQMPTHFFKKELMGLYIPENPLSYEGQFKEIHIVAPQDPKPGIS